MIVLLTVLLGAALLGIAVLAYGAWLLRKSHVAYRRLLLSIQPAAGQIWDQEGALLYVLEVNNGGVRFALQHPLVDGYSPQRSARLDSWEDWRTRLRSRRIVLLTENWR